MTPCLVHAPARVDLAGGTLDIWPVSAIIPDAVTLNCTLDGGVTVKIERISGSSVLFNENTKESGSVSSPHPDLKLLAGAMAVFAPQSETGFKITVKSDTPRGSGLGTSSVILSALLFGLSKVLEKPMTAMEIVRTAADIEARLIHAPTGIQDYIAPLFGGMNAIRFPMGKAAVTPIPIPESLRKRMILIFTGISHFSGAPNWEMIKGFFDNEEIKKAFYLLSEIANLAVSAAISGNVSALAIQMRKDYELRKSLPVQLLPNTTDLFDFLEHSPEVSGFRLCGAAGGGTIIVISTEKGHNKLQKQIHNLGYRTLNLTPQQRGIYLESQ